MMDARLQRRIQRYGWDKAAACYEQSWQRQLAPAQGTMLALAGLAPGERVVDVACGTGLVTFAAAEAVGPTGLVVGTDISEMMVTLAAARARSRNLRHVQFERMDAEDLSPLADASFDVALCGLGLMYVPDPLKAVREMTRLVMPGSTPSASSTPSSSSSNAEVTSDLGGRVVAAVWGQRKNCGWADIFPIVDARVKSEVCPMFFSLGTGDQLADVFRAAGLVDVVTERIETRLEWASDDEACGAAFVGGPVALAYGRFDERTRFRVQREYLDSIAQWRIRASAAGHSGQGTRNGQNGQNGYNEYGDGDAASRGPSRGYSVPGEFVIVAGRRPA
jgi:ubiquinone/menaquinone biosynthesis C-methylase UbiE